MAKTAKTSPRTNPHAGSSFDDFLQEDGIFEEVQARAIKRVLAEQLDDAMQSKQLSKLHMAQRMSTSRSQLDRVLDPGNLSIQLDTLVKAASAVGATVEIRLKPQRKRPSAVAS
jgi:predicted XRE-type DNA-binding protein